MIDLRTGPHGSVLFSSWVFPLPLPHKGKGGESTMRDSVDRVALRYLAAVLLGLVMLLQARKNGGVWSLAGR